MTSPEQFDLSAAGNTDNPCLLILRADGYDLWLEPIDERYLWCASKDGVGFMGHSGPELLGIVTLWQRFGANWNQQKPDVYDELVDKMDDLDDLDDMDEADGG